MASDVSHFPYGPTLARLLLALCIGLFIGIERERRHKEAGLRTFAFAALLGALGGLLGSPFSELALVLLGVLIVLLNIETIRTGEGAEITTSAALLLTGFAGILAGQGHTFTPTVVGITIAALLAWKEPLAGFSVALTEAEFRSAVLLSIVAFVVYPVLPRGSIDPWHLIDARNAWITVILIAALGFTNYVLLKLYGSRGIELAGFLGGLVNSTVTATTLAYRVRDSQGLFSDAASRGIALATAAMLARNAAILGALAPSALYAAAWPLGVMFAIATVTALYPFRRQRRTEGTASPLSSLTSPFSLGAALKFGGVFLALQVGGTLAQRSLGTGGLYAVSVAGGLVSSASAVAAAASMTSSEGLLPRVAGHAAIIASLASAYINLPVVLRIARDRTLTRRVAGGLAAITAGGIITIVIRDLFAR
jgi:uncharacterized membrane protein (DUF4010 family)